MNVDRPKLLFLVAEDWYFCSHRLPLAIAASEAGFDVVVVTRIGRHRDVIEAAGLKLIPLVSMRRASLNPVREIATLLELARIYWRERPVLVHHVAMKPVIYGSLVSRILCVPAQINALAGLGFVFSSSKKFAQILRPLVMILLRALFNNAQSRVIVQNLNDMRVLTERVGVAPGYVRLIRSAGVDLGKYRPTPLKGHVPIIVLAARMLWDKGVGEFVEASRLLKEKGTAARFVLVGDPDRENPSAISREQLVSWQEEGLVEWWGHRDDIPEVFSDAWVVCLPSYHEGMPKVLIEAMACARPIVTCEIPGCQELVANGKNGLLVPPRDAMALAKALEHLIRDRARCISMGQLGRQMAEEEYSVEQVAAKTIEIYEELLESC